MNYPPYSDIICVSFTDKNDDSDTALMWAKEFRKKLMNLKDAPEGATILPAREDERRSDGKARATFIIKAPAGSRAGYIQAYMMQRAHMIKTKAPCYIEIDVNPYGIV